MRRASASGGRTDGGSAEAAGACGGGVRASRPRGAAPGGQAALAERRHGPPPQVLELADGEEHTVGDGVLQVGEPVRRAAEGAKRVAGRSLA